MSTRHTLWASSALLALLCTGCGDDGGGVPDAGSPPPPRDTGPLFPDITIVRDAGSITGDGTRCGDRYCDPATEVCVRALRPGGYVFARCDSVGVGCVGDHSCACLCGCDEADPCSCLSCEDGPATNMVTCEMEFDRTCVGPDGDAGVACPDAAPTDGTACTGSLECAYGVDRCCGMSFPTTECTCDQGTWSCATGNACSTFDAGCPDAGAGGA